jgi:CRISPR/Cas system-associated exonuclease Cas4 (RecB family)
VARYTAGLMPVSAWAPSETSALVEAPERSERGGSTGPFRIGARPKNRKLIGPLSASSLEMTRMRAKFWEFLGWSFTRHRVLSSCPRQYWYEYIGPNDYDVPDADRSRLWDLKRLESLTYLKGKIVHDRIDAILPDLVAKRAVDQDQLLSAVTEQVESARSSATSTIVEYQNGVPFSEAYFDNIRTESVEQMSTFLHVMWPPLSTLGYVQHEKFDHFKVEDAQVTVKLDCVLERPDRTLVIVDWKTGNDDERYESRLQLAAYATWASLQRNSPPERTEVQLSFLKSARTKRIAITPTDLAAARETIIADWSEFSHPKGFDAYVATPEPRLCTSCRFASLCDKAALSREMLGSDDD